MKYLSGTKAQVQAVRAALKAALGLPVRGVTLGGPDNISRSYDEAGNEIPGPGWTVDAVADPIDVGAVSVVEIPDEIQNHPALAKLLTNMKDEAQLTAAVRAFLAARQAA